MSLCSSASWRTIAFLIGCIGVRIGVAVLLALSSAPLHRYLLAGLTGAIATGFVLIYVFRLRRRGFEAGGKIWWDGLRPLHGAAYATAAWLVWRGHGVPAGVVVLLDALVGLGAFVHHRFLSHTT